MPDENSNRFVAKRSSNGRWALCVRPNAGGICGEHLAEIVPGSELILLSVDGDPPEDTVNLGDGFVRDVEGFWRLGDRARSEWEADRRRGRGDERAATRLREGRSRRHRRAMLFSPLDTETGSLGVWHHSTTDQDSWSRTDLKRTEQIVRCPACNLLNRLTAGLLDTDQQC